MSDETIKYATLIARELSKKSDSGRFDLEKVIKLEIAGVFIEVGPFVKSQMEWEERWLLDMGDNIVITCSDEKVDSWGSCYGNSGINFDLERIVSVEVKKVYTTEYLQYDPNGFPQRFEW